VGIDVSQIWKENPSQLGLVLHNLFVAYFCHSSFVSSEGFKIVSNRV
jgi:trehalose-6-phosphate synthase